MSLYKNYYVIAGYDLTGYATEKYDDWKWTDEGEKYICHQSKGNIQLFDDPCNVEHLYLGYVLAHGDQYEFSKTNINIKSIEYQFSFVNHKLLELIDLGVINKTCLQTVGYQVFVFEEVN